MLTASTTRLKHNNIKVAFNPQIENWSSVLVKDP